MSTQSVLSAHPGGRLAGAFRDRAKGGRQALPIHLPSISWKRGRCRAGKRIVALHALSARINERAWAAASPTCWRRSRAPRVQRPFQPDPRSGIARRLGRGRNFARRDIPVFPAKCGRFGPRCFELDVQAGQCRAEADQVAPLLSHLGNHFDYVLVDAGKDVPPAALAGVPCPGRLDLHPLRPDRRKPVRHRSYSSGELASDHGGTYKHISPSSARITSKWRSKFADECEKAGCAVHSILRGFPLAGLDGDDGPLAFLRRSNPPHGPRNWPLPRGPCPLLGRRARAGAHRRHPGARRERHRDRRRRRDQHGRLCRRRSGLTAIDGMRLRKDRARPRSGAGACSTSWTPSSRRARASSGHGAWARAAPGYRQHPFHRTGPSPARGGDRFRNAGSCGLFPRRGGCGRSRPASRSPASASRSSLDGRMLIDGGIADPLPADVLSDMGIERIIAVNTLPTPAHLAMLSRCARGIDRPEKPRGIAAWFNKHLNYFARGNLCDILMRANFGAQMRVAEQAAASGRRGPAPVGLRRPLARFREPRQIHRPRSQGREEQLSEIKALTQPHETPTAALALAG